MQTSSKDECTCVVAFTTATDRRKLIDIPPVYTIHVDNSQHTERACFPYFLSAYIRLCHCLESFYIYVQPFEMFTTFSRKLEKFKYRCIILFNTLCDTVRDKIYSDVLKKQI